ncbi:MAG TPA: proton-conducting transporter membrane subunit, partial [Anaerolineales bacterium]|nr:proton-conducting transporter membrane subunit [Anaerolineales bacterium]
MNAPTLWIIFPIVLGILMLFINNQRILSVLGGSFAVVLALIAQFVPIEAALKVASFSLKIDSGLVILGRSLIIPPTEGSLLALIYGAAALWFFGAEASKTALRLVPLGFMIIALMVASIAVQPFLYAALFIEMAILLAIPMLTSIYRTPGRGVVRFLIYQTLAMPFILLAGWLLAGVEASPGDLALTAQSATMLGMGFAFLLAIFPLYSWIPLLIEENSPYIVGFLLWILPTITIIFGAGFLDRYSWLRSSPQLILALRYLGLLMVVTGGGFAAFQRHLGRIMAYGSIAETGFSLLALSLDLRLGIPILFLLIPARALGLAVWSLSLTIIRGNVENMRFGAARGILRAMPVAGAGMVVATLSTGAFPLLAGFPSRLALWEGLSRDSISAALWMAVGIVGLLTSAFRSLAVISMADEYTDWAVRETPTQMTMLGLGMIGLFLLGLFPQSVQFFMANLPLMFEHLG